MAAESQGTRTQVEALYMKKSDPRRPPRYVFPPDKDDKEDAIFLKKILKKEAAWKVIKNVLGF